MKTPKILRCRYLPLYLTLCRGGGFFVSGEVQGERKQYFFSRSDRTFEPDMVGETVADCHSSVVVDGQASMYRQLGSALKYFRPIIRSKRNPNLIWVELMVTFPPYCRKQVTQCIYKRKKNASYNFTLSRC